MANGFGRPKSIKGYARRNRTLTNKMEDATRTIPPLEGRRVEVTEDESSLAERFGKAIEE